NGDGGGGGWSSWMGDGMKKSFGGTSTFIGDGWTNLAEWLYSTRSVGAVCFVFGMYGRSFHIFDALLQDYKSSFPAYLYCPSITFFSTIAVLILMGMDNAQIENAQSLPQVLTMVSCCGVLAGAIIEEQLEIVPHANLTDKDHYFVGVACVFLSFSVYVLGYGWNEPMKGVLKRGILIVTPIWIIILYQFFPLSSLPTQLGLFMAFTLGVGIVDHYVTDIRGRVPIFTSVFPPNYIGCLVQSFAMVALATYYTSLRLSFFSDSWFSFSWMMFAGAPLDVFTLICHLIYWTSEKIFGPGPHNSFYVLRAVLFSWSIALAVHQFGFYDEIPKLKFW
ncbi:hypothetical protein PRIPAC_86019, partial [Pristionchus pacificus]